jgi:hypothetical protein
MKVFGSHQRPRSVGIVCRPRGAQSAIEKVEERLFEGEEAVLHVMG